MDTLLHYTHFRVHIKNVNGSIDITPWNLIKGNEVNIKWAKEQRQDWKIDYK